MAIFLTIPDAARQLGISRNHLYKLIRAGTIPCYRFSSRSIRLNLDEVIAAARPKQKATSVSTEQQSLV